jgi:hypothetical protein
MVTSALFARFLAQGSVWQLPREDLVRESEDAGESVETGLSTESEGRRADVFVGEVKGLEDKQHLEELLRELSMGLRGINGLIGGDVPWGSMRKSGSRR